MYELLAKRPSRACSANLRVAVANEPDHDGALDAGLIALAAHGDGSQTARARAIAEGVDPRTADSRQRAAWIYLSGVGALDSEPARHRTILEGLIAADGASASAACEAAIMRSAIAGSG
jgi:hypothetical protein